MIRTVFTGPSIVRCCHSAVLPLSWISARHPTFRHSLRLISSDSRSNSSDTETSSGSPNSSDAPASFSQHARRPTTAYGDHLTDVKDRLRGWSERTSVSLRQHVDQYTASLAVTFAQLGKELNKVTGYGEIEVLKQRVVEQEKRIDAVRRAAREAKEAYDKAVLQRANSQREVNDLLQRKSSWTDEDVIRFTSLVRQDHLHEQEEARAKAAAVQAEDAVEREFSELMRVILNRYHEEQAWSDKIRSASTYGSLAVMGVNMLVFLLAIVLVEPWKRRRLAQTFERKVEEMSAESATTLESKTEQLMAKLEGQDQLLAQIIESIYYSSHAPEIDPAAAPQIDTAGVAQHPPSEATRSNRDLVLAIATSATAAGIIGWLARSWFS